MAQSDKSQPPRLLMNQRPLDDASPSQEQYNRFYALAKRLADDRPWEYLEETQVLAVERDPDETDFVSVMGALGSHFAVAVYPSLLTLNEFMRIDECVGYEAQDLFSEVFQTQVVFGSKTRLFPGEREAILASGQVFKNGKWPSVHVYVPGYFPWKVGAVGIETLCVTLEQLLVKLEGGGLIPVARDLHASFCTRSLRDGVWTECQRKHTHKAMPQPIALPPGLVENVCALPKRQASFEVDCFPMETPVGPRGQRAQNPRQLVVVERSSGVAIAFQMLVAEEGRPWFCGRAVAPFLQQLVKIGYRPASVAFAGGFSRSWGEPLCKMLDIRVDGGPCRAFLSYRKRLEGFFRR